MASIKHDSMFSQNCDNYTVRKLLFDFLNYSIHREIEALIILSFMQNFQASLCCKGTAMDKANVNEVI